MNSLQSKLIAETMDDLRGRVAKRQKTGAVDQSVMLNDHVYDEKESLPCHDGDGDDDGSSSSNSSRFDSDDDDGSCCDGSSRFDILEELDAHPHVIQVVATSGGLITHWNEPFSKITKPSASLKKIPLTIFELVDSKSLPSLYSMLALSLHNIGMVEVENFPLDGHDDEKLSRSCSHLSITLPCKSFRNSSKHYNITVVFMNDIAAMKRCFLGILTPRMQAASAKERDVALNEHAAATPRHMPCGKILRVDDDLLCQTLL